MTSIYVPRSNHFITSPGIIFLLHFVARNAPETSEIRQIDPTDYRFRYTRWLFSSTFCAQPLQKAEGIATTNSIYITQWHHNTVFQNFQLGLHEIDLNFIWSVSYSHLNLSLSNWWFLRNICTAPVVGQKTNRVSREPRDTVPEKDSRSLSTGDIVALTR